MIEGAAQHLDDYLLLPTTTSGRTHYYRGPYLLLPRALYLLYYYRGPYLLGPYLLGPYLLGPLLLTAHCSLLTAHCSLLAAHCSLLAASYCSLLPTT